MKLFGQIIRTVVNAAMVPVKVAADVVMAPVDAGEGQRVGERTREAIEKLKDEAGE